MSQRIREDSGKRKGGRRKGADAAGEDEGGRISWGSGMVALPVLPALGRGKPEDREFKASLCSLVSLNPTQVIKVKNKIDNYEMVPCFSQNPTLKNYK